MCSAVQTYAIIMFCTYGFPALASQLLSSLIVLTVEIISEFFLSSQGPLTMCIQELDGSFNHTFKIEENKTKFEITCHSKSRRNKKKKIPLMTGEEVDMDLNAME